MTSTSRFGLVPRRVRARSRWLAGVRCGASRVMVVRGHRAVSEKIEDDRELPRGARGFDPASRRRARTTRSTWVQ